MSELFGRNRVAITQHIGNIFREGELDQKVVCKDFLHTTQHGAIKGKRQTKSIKLYDLDVIISVGYRVKSQWGTQFRQWATQRLRDYLVLGYAINEKRLAQKQQEVEYLKTGIRILNRAMTEQTTSEEYEMLRVFAIGLELLDDFDHETLDKKGQTLKETIYPTYGDELISRGVLNKHIGYCFKGWELFHHQTQATEIGSRNESFVVTSCTGSGKSLTFLATWILCKRHSGARQ
jgi:hypothetical protein